MGPTIMLDKSSMQSLSRMEVVVLHNLYFINIAPVLTIEILGDLKKQTGLTRSDVYHLSRKLLQEDSAINVHYLSLLKEDLLGRRIEMSGRPLKGGGTRVIRTDGKKGVIFEESLEEQAIRRWQNEEFTEAEHILSERWRMSTTGRNVEEFQRTLQTAFPTSLPFQNLKDIRDWVDQIFDNNNIEVKRELLITFFDFFPMMQDIASEVFLRWEHDKYPDLKKFAPYAHHCFCVLLVFMFGLRQKLLGTKATNFVDLEYLYYLPFTIVFSSRDKFHKLFVPLFLNENQTFLDGDDLKKDLAAIKAYADSNTDGKILRPPRPDDSIASKLWQKYSSLPQSSTDTEFDFIERRRTITIDDPCPCGSGKPYRDCHLKQSDSTTMH